MTQIELYTALAKLTGLDLKQAGDLAEAIFDEIASSLSQGEGVIVDDFGEFFTVKQPEHSDTDSDGNKIIIPSEITPEFEPDKHFVDLITKAIEKNPGLFTKPEDKESVELNNKKGSENRISSANSQSQNNPQGYEVSTRMEIKEEDLPDMPKSEMVKSNNPDSDIKQINNEEKKDLDSLGDKKTIEPKKTDEKPLGRASNIVFRDLAGIKVEKEILSIIPLEIAKQYKAVPVDLQEGVLTVAMIDPEDFDALQVIRKETGLDLEPILTTRDDLGSILDQYTGLQAELQEVIDHADLGISLEDVAEATNEEVMEDNEDAPTSRIVQSLLKRAVKERASDIHIEPYEKKLVVRFRVDGVLQPRVELPKEVQSAIISRLKILADLKIDEQRLPQDGRLSLAIDRRMVDFRLSTMPVVFGEKAVMRILDKSVGIISLEEVGLSDRGLDVLNKNMQRSHGMILVTGPTGSGKTTSLYAVLGKMMDESVNIITLEDPVEYRIESINQSQMHNDIGYSFAQGLRAVVRQDPDIVMLGEIRDQETADMAIHAALTGHVVLSTLHTNDAAGAFPRLIDMHVEPFLITSSIHTVIAQRLARKICENCKESYNVGKETVEEIELEIDKMPKQFREVLKSKKLEFFHGKGCDKCSNKGYKGRIGLFEVLDVTEDVRSLVMKRSSGADITKVAIDAGMVTMVQDGIIKASRGLTTMEEVWRVTKE